MSCFAEVSAVFDRYRLRYGLLQLFGEAGEQVA
jgi:hypothetical protein